MTAADADETSPTSQSEGNKSSHNERPAGQRQQAASGEQRTSNNRNRNRRRNTHSGQQSRPQERNPTPEGKEPRGDNKQGQLKRGRNSEQAQGRNEGNRRTNGDKPADTQDTVAVTAPQNTRDASSEHDKPRKRPSNIKRGEPQRRRRNRGPKPMSEGTAAVEATEIDAATAVVPDFPEPELTLPATPEVAEDTTTSASEHPSSTSTDPISEDVTSAPVSLSAASSDDGWESVPTDDPVESAPEVAITPTASAAEETPVAVTSVTTPVPVAAQTATPIAPSKDGVSADGRACNDPRNDARPVGELEISTSHMTLFSDIISPPAEPINRTVPRSSNDPRGPRSADPIAQAAGQS